MSSIGSSILKSFFHFFETTTDQETSKEEVNRKTHTPLDTGYSAQKIKKTPMDLVNEQRIEKIFVCAVLDHLNKNYHDPKMLHKADIEQQIAELYRNAPKYFKEIPDTFCDLIDVLIFKEKPKQPWTGTITIRLTSNQTFKLPVKEDKQYAIWKDIRVRDVKEQIFEKLKISPERQSLLISGESLIDALPLSYYCCPSKPVTIYQTSGSTSPNFDFQKACDAFQRAALACQFSQNKTSVAYIAARLAKKNAEVKAEAAEQTLKAAEQAKAAAEKALKDAEQAKAVAEKAKAAAECAKKYYETRLLLKDTEAEAKAAEQAKAAVEKTKADAYTERYLEAGLLLKKIFQSKDVANKAATNANDLETGS